MRRRYGRRSRVGRARRYKKKTSTSLRRTVTRIVNRQIETKEFRQSYSPYASVSYGNSSVVTGIFGAINPGVSQAQRIGNRLKATGVRIYFPISAGDTINTLRFMVVSPKAGTTVQPNAPGNFVAQVLSGAASSGVQYASPIDTSRFHVHLDRTFFLTYDPVDGSTANVKPRIKYFKSFIKINRTIFWDNSGVINNDVYFVAISDSQIAPHPGAIAGFYTAYFKDA